jgi:hypothetical protein
MAKKMKQTWVRDHKRGKNPPPSELVFPLILDLIEDIFEHSDRKKREKLSTNTTN